MIFYQFFLEILNQSNKEFSLLKTTITSFIAKKDFSNLASFYSGYKSTTKV